MSGMVEKIYIISPYFIKVLLFNIKALFNNYLRYSSFYENRLERYNKLWNSSRSEILKFQKEELTKLLLECYEYTLYYRKIFDSLSISPDEIKNDPYQVLSKLPILEKQTRKDRFKEIVNINPKRKLVTINHTSGTSGSPLITHSDHKSIATNFAFWSRFHKNLGITRKDKSVRFSGRILVNPKRAKKRFWIYNFINRQLFMSTYHLSTDNIPQYVKKLNKFQPEYMDGYASAFYVLAKEIESLNLELNLNLKAITITK